MKKYVCHLEIGSLCVYILALLNHCRNTKWSFNCSKASACIVAVVDSLLDDVAVVDSLLDDVVVAVLVTALKLALCAWLFQLCIYLFTQHLVLLHFHTQNNRLE